MSGIAFILILVDATPQRRNEWALQGLMLLSTFTAACGCYVRSLVDWNFLEGYLIRIIRTRPLKWTASVLVAMTGAVAYCLS